MLSSPSSPHTTTISPDSTAPPPLAASPTLDSLTPVLVCPQLVRHKASNCPGAYVRNPSASQLHSRFCALVLLHLSLVHAAAKSCERCCILASQTWPYMCSTYKHVSCTLCCLVPEPLRHLPAKPSPSACRPRTSCLAVVLFRFLLTDCRLIFGPPLLAASWGSTNTLMAQLCHGRVRYF